MTRTASPTSGEAIAARDAARAQAIVGQLIAEGGEAEWAGAVEQLVRAIADNRRALLPLRTLFPELARTVKDPWRARTPPLDERQAIAETPANLAVSIRIDPALELQIETDGRLGRATLSRNGLVFTHARKPTATITGPDDRLALLERLVEGERLMPSELEAVLLPRDLDAFALWRGARVTEVTELLEEGRVLVEAVERLVCRLYDLPAELEEAVVRHAAEQAVAGLPAEE